MSAWSSARSEPRPFRNSVGVARLTLTFTNSSGQNWRPDQELLRRIKTAYREAIRRYKQPKGSMWGDIAKKRQEIHDSLMSDNDERTIDLLANPAKTELYFGMDTVVNHLVSAIRDSEESRLHIQDAVKNHFVALAETIGASRAWYFEVRGPNRTELTDQDVEETLAGIDAVLGAPTTYPNPFPQEFGIKTSRGIIVHRTSMALYQAYRLQAVSSLVGGRRVLEIGPGNGRCAYYAGSIGFTDYTTIDLPMGIVGQACFLAATIGPDKIWMVGDPVSEQKGRVRLMPPHFLDGCKERFDIVLNADSLTEMSPDQAISYVKFAKDHSRALVSINHEFNKYTVQQLASMAGVTDKPQRSVSSIRPGYIEELYIWTSLNSELLRQEIDQLRSSTSWRITAPLRKIRQVSRTYSHVMRATRAKSRVLSKLRQLTESQHGRPRRL
jgi:hypothetical protein